MAGYDNVLVCHTKHIVEADGKKRYPWVEYVFKNLTPSAFSSSNNKFYISCTDGNIYILDSTIVEDAGTLPDYTLTSGIEEAPFSTAIFNGLYTKIDSSSWSLDNKTNISFDETAGVYTINGTGFEVASLGIGVKFRLSGSTNNNGVFTVSSTTTTTTVITVNEAVTDEAAGRTISISLDYGSLSFYKNGSSSAFVTKSINANNSPRREKIRFNVKSIQWSLHTLTLSNQFRFQGLSMEVKQIGAKI